MLFIDEDVTCACGETFTAALARSLNPEENPEVREAVTGGEVNVVRCPACGTVFYAERFVLYHDPGRELIAFVYPADLRPRAAELRVQMHEQVEQSRGVSDKEERIGYPPLLLFGMDELAMLLRADEDAADETAVLAAVADELGLEVVYAPQGEARLRGLMPCLPAVPAPGGTVNAAVREGLRLLTDYNPALTRYVSVRALLGNDCRLLDGLALAHGTVKRPASKSKVNQKYLTNSPENK